MSKSNFILILLTVLSSVVSHAAFSQLRINRFEQIDSLQKTAPRNIVVFIHTDWCRYCQAMKSTTFKDKKIIQLLNEKFWFASLDAEEKQGIFFNGRTFKYKPTGSNTGIHELAEQLGTVNGKVAYPTVCIMNANYEIIFQHNQFLSPAALLQVLSKASGN